MGYAELIHERLRQLPQEKLAEVFDFVEFIMVRSRVGESAGEEGGRQARLIEALRAAQKSFPKLPEAELEPALAAQRAEWEGRGWDGEAVRS